MYKFNYFDANVKLILSDRKAFWDPALEEELSPVLEALKKTGEMEGASCYVQPGIAALVYQLKGKNFQITYTVDPPGKEIKFYEFKQISYSIEWKTVLGHNSSDEEHQSVYIPQIGDPYKLINAIKLIYSGANTPLALGIKSGSRAKKNKDLARRGYYLGRTSN